MKPIPLGPFFLTFWMILSTASSETCECQKKTTKRVVGELAKDTEFLSTVKVDGKACAGTLIDKEFVVTAASCFGFYGTNLNFEIVYGQKAIKPIVKKIDPSSVIIHESYNKTTRANNIALIKLSKPLTLDSTVSVSCLPKGIDRTKLQSMKVSVAAWGETRQHTPETNEWDSSNKLHKVDGLTVFDNNRCKYYIAPNKDRDNMFCAYSPKGSPCQLDEGGTVVGDYNGASYFVGMVIEEENACGLMAPSFYLNVANYIDWIESKVGKKFCAPSVA